MADTLVGAPGTVARAAAAKTVPVSRERLGLAGGADRRRHTPVARLCRTSCPFHRLPGSSPFHHSRPVAPFRLQSVIVRLVKLLPAATSTSKYPPGVEKLGLATGSLAYWDTVTAPTPVPLAVVASLVALQVPDELEDEQFCELVPPAGGEGGEGGEDDEGGGPPDGGGVTTAELAVRAKPHVPVSPLVSLSVPETV